MSQLVEADYLQRLSPRLGNSPRSRQVRYFGPYAVMLDNHRGGWPSLSAQDLGNRDQPGR